MELVSNYMRDDTLRHALNDLTKKTFGFDFEGWVTGGYFEGDYIPYSFIKEGKIVFNVSANQVTLSDVLQRMGVEFHKCRPGFTPAQNDRYMCIVEYYNGSDDYRLFYLGQELKSIEQDKLSFSELSHA